MQNNEEALELKNILSSIPNNIYWVDKNNIFWGCNAEHARVFGLCNENEIVGKSYYDLMSKEYADVAMAANNEVMQTGQIKILEELALLPDGREAIFLSHKAPMYGQNKKIIGIIGNSINITPRETHQTINSNHFSHLIPEIFDGVGEYNTVGEYIVAIKNYYESMLAQIPGHIYWEDSNGTILGCNDAQALDSGLHDRKEVIGKTIFDFLPREQALAHIKNNRLVTETGAPQIFEEVSFHADGKQAVYVSQKIPIKNKKGEVVRIFGVSLDITDRKRAEEYHLQQEIAKAEAAQKTATFINLMASAMAHELRTPFGSMEAAASDISQQLPKLIGAYELAKSNNLSVEKIRSWQLDMLKKSAEDISREVYFSNVIIDMLLMNIKGVKIDPGTFELCSAARCIEEALARYPFAENELALVSFENNGNSENVADFQFKGNALLLTHVLFNLLKNALYYVIKAQKGGIVIWLESGKNHNKLHFKDTGLGILPEILPQIFEQFFTKTHGGTGVGLSFCKGVMKGLGGDIVCSSEPNEFTEFVLSFPKV